ncbi:F-box/LRR-repeat protein At2g43260 isoform X2 [Brachypodium distachyon]|uniref:F-box domain-containing protein n=1 Tax=Brachypodium distachyon TaxID=15368 RepID=I1IE93_BRADI|nr:F-box/LRR-repeat protein At2g43260 isoform X2 [Brachypodium distachyon]KQK01495.1 hypothetical protein BRADI_3g56200v3 [Brachypodium distachyon]|eukprot:XP_003570451.1 F-box/LRR-repeat protein At2g43260 isoform X2 [Brachypodium distachyon]
MKCRSIPDDLIINEILILLPVKSLLRCRCVCKAWHSAISSRHLIELHRQQSQSKVHLLHGSYDIPHGVNSINIERLTEEDKLEDYYRLPLLENFVMINSCRDLICLAYDDGYLLSNPATRELVYVPHASWDLDDTHFTGFGFVSSLGKYKVISITLGTPDTCEVFTVGLDCSWWKAESPPCPAFTVSGRTSYVNGNLHMLSQDSFDENGKLLLFNLEKEAWSVKPLPDWPSEFDWPIELREMQGLLCFICCIPDNRIDIWILRDYANNVWSKGFVIDVTQVVGMPDEMDFGLGPHYFGWFPLEVMTDGRILLQKDAIDDDRWFYYDPWDGSIQLADQTGMFHRTLRYGENLVPILGF